MRRNMLCSQCLINVHRCKSKKKRCSLEYGLMFIICLKLNADVFISVTFMHTDSKLDMLVVVRRFCFVTLKKLQARKTAGLCFT